MQYEKQRIRVHLFSCAICISIDIYHRNSNNNNNIGTRHIDINTHNFSNNINNSNKY